MVQDSRPYVQFPPLNAILMNCWTIISLEERENATTKPIIYVIQN